MYRKRRKIYESYWHWHNMGFDMISAGADFDFLRESFKQNREMLKKVHLDL